MKYVIYMNGEEPTTAIQEIIERECGRECEVIATPDKELLFQCIEKIF